MLSQGIFGAKSTQLTPVKWVFEKDDNVTITFFVTA